MSEFAPLAFHSYDWQRLGLGADKLASPPYDVLSPQARADLASRSPYNVVHIDLPRSYEEAAGLLADWRGEGVVARAGAPAYYLLASDFELDGQLHTRFGLLGGIRLAPWGERGVFPHERTYPKHKKDRLELMRATKAQLSPIFGVFQESTGLVGRIGAELDRTEPVVVYQADDGVRYRLWRVGDEQARAVGELFAGRNIYIADGHHRYETALAYAQERGMGSEAAPNPWDFVFAHVSDIASEGVKILPYHRLLTWHGKFDWDKAMRLASERFELKALSSMDDLWSAASPSACALVQNGQRQLMIPKDPEAGLAAEERVFAQVGSYVLDRDFLRGCLGMTEQDLASGDFLTYSPFHEAALEAVEDGHAQAALLLKAVDMELLQAVSERGLTMPRKSTYFHPKVPTGLLFHLFE